LGGHLHRSNRAALGAVEFLRSVESVALGHEVRCSVSQAGDHSRTVAKQSHRVGMAFMDAPAGVHVMQTLVDDRSIGVQKGVWVSRDSFIGALSMSRKARKGSCSFPGVAFHSAKIAKRGTRWQWRRRSHKPRKILLVSLLRKRQIAACQCYFQCGSLSDSRRRPESRCWRYIGLGT